MIITTHKYPDPDAIISTILIAKILEKKGKRFKIVLPSKPSKSLAEFLKKYYDFEVGSIEEPIIAVDVAHKSQINQTKILNGICFDHHKNREQVCKKEIVKIRTSCAEVIYETYPRLFDKEMFLLLGCAIYWDSGQFKTVYETTCRNFKKVLKYYDFDTIVNFLELKPDENYYIELSRAYKNSKIIKAGNYYVIISKTERITGEICESLNMGDLTIVYNSLGKISLRGKISALNFAKYLAEKYGYKYGGHDKACVILTDGENIEKKILDCLSEYFGNLKFL
jgi:nanoRNase/pAp phosphatase (c-di-AMP/oligoRNAs hydrolase)